jgi:hypothetical protein
MKESRKTIDSARLAVPKIQPWWNITACNMQPDKKSGLPIVGRLLSTYRRCLLTLVPVSTGTRYVAKSTSKYLVPWHFCSSTFAICEWEWWCEWWLKTRRIIIKMKFLQMTSRRTFVSHTNPLSTLSHSTTLCIFLSRSGVKSWMPATTLCSFNSSYHHYPHITTTLNLLPIYDPLNLLRCTWWQWHTLSWIRSNLEYLLSDDHSTNIPNWMQIHVQTMGKRVPARRLSLSLVNRRERTLL